MSAAARAENHDPVTGRTSSRRYRSYLDRRREKIKQDKGHLKNEEQPTDRSRSFVELGRGFWRLLSDHHPTVYFILAVLTVSVVFSLALPYSVKVVTDYIVADTPGPEALAPYVALPRFADGPNAGEVDRGAMLFWLAGLMIVTAAVSTAIGMTGRWLATKLTKLLMVELRHKVFDHAMQLPLHRVHEIKSGGVASTLREDAGGAAELIFHLLYNPWRAVIQLVGSLIILAFVDWLMLVGALLFIPLVWLTHRTWIGLIRPIYRDVRRTRQDIDASAAESFGGMRVVRGFAQTRSEAKRFVGSNNYMIRQEILAWWWSRSVDIAWALLIPVATTAVILFGGRRVLDGTLTIGDVITFVAYVGFLLGPLEMLASSATNAQNSLAALDRSLDVLDEPTEFAATNAARAGAALRVVDSASARGEIEVRGLTFAYPAPTNAKGDEAQAPRQHVLEDISLRVSPGETIALVGQSGSGKTTLCNLIARFYDPTHGSVLFDGHDLRDTDVASYRRLLGIVEQDVFLFDGTIAQNIAYARKDATEDDIVRAATLAAAHDFITDTERGYATVIGERGVRLSGGQKQRLAIARAILADPRVLILDEATSNLDAESEALIQRSLRTLMDGRTTFVIAHRLSTIRSADRIIVLERGRLVEQGTHHELIEQGGRYATLLRMQLDPGEAEQLT
ncbi:MAG: ABC transporter ATP-binding protein [Planctomycetota bacterium]